MESGSGTMIAGLGKSGSVAIITGTVTGVAKRLKSRFFTQRSRGRSSRSGSGVSVSRSTLIGRAEQKAPAHWQIEVYQVGSNFSVDVSKILGVCA